jgi:hypothetical protein
MLASPAPLTFYLPQSLLISTKMMSYFMAHYFPYFHLNFLAKATLRLYGFSEDAYLIRQNHSIPSTSSGLGYTLVKA